MKTKINLIIASILILCANVNAQYCWNSLSNCAFCSSQHYAILSAKNGLVIMENGPGEIYRSTDGGNNWTESSYYLNDDVLCFAFNPNNGYIYAGLLDYNHTTGGIYRSIDSGLNFSQVGLSGYSVNTIVVNNNGDVYAACHSGDVSYNGLFKSTDNGNTWNPVLSNAYPIYSLAKDDGGNIYVGTEDPGPNTYAWILKSSDNGNTWDNIFSNSVGNIQGITIDQVGNIFFANGNIYRSINGGNTWTQVYFSGNIDNYDAIPFISDNCNNIFVASNSDGILMSNDTGNTWQPVNSGFSYPYAITIDPDSSYLYASVFGYPYLYKSCYPTCSSSISCQINWDTIPNLDSNRVRAQAEVYNNQVYCIGGYNGSNGNNTIEIFNGSSWSSNGQNMLQSRYEFTSCILNNGIYVFGGYTSPSNVTDSIEFYNGSNWSFAGTIANSSLSLHDMDGTAVNNDFYMCGGIANVTGTFIYDNHLRKFTPPSTWADLDTLPFSSRSGYKCVTLNGYIYVIGGAYAISSTDLAPQYYKNVWRYNPSDGSWAQMDSLNVQRVDFACGVINGNIYVVGGLNKYGTALNSVEMYDTVLKSWVICTNSPTEISRPASTVLNDNFYILGGDINNKKCYGSTFFTGITELPSNKVGIKIYPNPFTNSITIEIKSEIVSPKSKIFIYDILGQEVYQQTLNAKQETLNLNLPSGIYFYKITNDKEIIGTGKLVIQ